MQSRITKRSVVLAGRKTSVSLEDDFWEALKYIAGRRHQAVAELIISIDAERTHSNLSSALRLFVLNHYQEHSSERVEESGAHAGSPSAPMPSSRVA